MASLPRLVIIVGPTGAGKTKLAIELALRANGEIVSCDSQQLYRGMDIGTGKASAEERAAVPHHLLDVANPDEEMTAARYVELADAAIADIAKRDRAAIICGGTGLYVRALLFGLFDGPPADLRLRADLEAEVGEIGVHGLHDRLAAIDPLAAERIERNDQRRIIRALEVFTLTGTPMSTHWARHDHRSLPSRYTVQLVGIAPEREALYRTIDTRVAAMFDAGLIAEVQALRAAGYAPPMRSQLAIGYAEIHAHLEGKADLAQTITLVQRNSRHYARRQLSWYRGDDTVTWSTAGAAVDLDALQRYLRSSS